MKLHNSIFSSLSHAASWAGFAGILSTLGAQLDKPYSILCWVCSAACSVVAILLKTPSDPEDHKKEKHL